jgi:hypothetical protein
MMLALAGLCCALTVAVAEERDPITEYSPRPVIDGRQFFTGNTVNAVAFLPVDPSEPHLAAPGSGSLLRIMFQAYLRPDGEALVRSWDARVGRYTPVSNQPWRLDGSTLCLAVPSFELREPLCFDVHLWGRNFAGHGVNANGMIKGDVKPGNGLTQ